MWDRLLLAMDQSDTGQAALSMAVGLAAASGAGVVVLHVRERSPYLQVPPLETMVEARALVGDAVAELGLDGIRAHPVVRSAGQHQVAGLIVREAATWACGAIVLGSTRLRGLRRINGTGVRERVIRSSPLPVLLAPPALQCRARMPARHAPDHRSVDHR
jgi:nucleotide-binding universal stress UspA family protein